MRIYKTAIATLALCLSAAPGAFAQGSTTTQQSADAYIVGSPKIDSVSENSAVVAWTTSAKASSVVNYGTSRDKLDQSARAEWGGPEHKVTISGLQPNTTYFYQVMSGDAEGSGTGALSRIQTFQTKGSGQTADSNSADSRDTRIVSGPRIENVTGSSAIIRWTTNVKSSSTVRYGTNRRNLDQIARGGWGGPEHEVRIENLQPGTNYFFQVISSDGFGTGTGALARVSRFRTAGESQNTAASAGDVKITVDPSIQTVNENSAVLTWTTSAKTSAVVKYGTDAKNLDKTAKAPWGGPEHRLTLTGLEPGTRYYFQVVSGDAEGSGATATSRIDSFPTNGEARAAASNVVKDQVSVQAGPIPQNVTDKSATLWWMTSGDTRTVVRYGTNKNQLDQTAQSTAGSEHKVTLNNLQPSTVYYFEVMSHDNLVRTAGQFQTEAANFAADAKKLRIINGPVVEYVSKDAAIVAWSTNVRASSVVRYGTDPNNLNQTAQAPWGQDTHRVRIANLKADTAYYFVIESSQAEGTGTMAKSNPAPFKTVPEGAQALKTNFGTQR